MPGHPDGQNYALWRGPNFIANPTFPLSNSNPCIVAGQVTNYSSLMFNLQCNVVGGVSIAIAYFTDQAMTNQVFAQGWVLPQNGVLNVILPIAGNYVQLTVTTPTVAATNTPISLYPTNTPTHKRSYLTTGNVIQGFNVSVPASSTITALLPFLAAGHGYVFISDRASSGHLTGRVVTVGQNGNAIARLIDYNTLVATQAQLFIAPEYMIRIEVDNSDAAAAHNVNYYLSADGR